MERKGERERERGCTGTAPVAEMSGSGYKQGGKWRPKTLYMYVEEDILRDERGRKRGEEEERMDGGEKDRKAVRKEGEGREGGEEGGRRE
jgi:hypothetical protein